MIVTELTPSPAVAASRFGRNDPLLQELWASKATLNAEANYRIDQLLARTQAFDLDSELKRLVEAAAH
jgi:hypothetical protein